MKNKKQLAWSQNKVLRSRMKIIQNFAIAIGVILAIYVIGSVITGNLSMDHFFDLAGSGSVITAGVVSGFGNIDGDPDNTQKIGKQIKARLWFIEQAQVDDTQQFPAAINGEVANIPLKAGEKWKYIDSVIDTPSLKWSGTQGEIAAVINTEITLIIGGMSTDIFNYLKIGIGKGFYVVLQICATSENYIGGNSCKPLRMTKFDGGSDKDKTATTITFANECGDILNKYVGSTPIADPVTVAADATTILLTSNPVYQLTTAATSAKAITAITGTSDSDVGRIITLQGSGGAFPSTIAASATFLLIGGATWTANAGKQISFKIFGGATYVFVEVAGSRN